MKSLIYTRLWAEIVNDETSYCFKGSHEVFRLIAQRYREVESQYSDKTFITTSDREAAELVTGNYDKRWGVEEFFNVENKMNINRVGSF
ncbi:MAG TPA: hypothetical protein PKC30_10130 [Saprospiraceae bacterium]|nr:hypothetical protein [Saprospiraceae bacterium]